MNKDEALQAYRKLLKELEFVLRNPRKWELVPHLLAAEIKFVLDTYEGAKDDGETR